MIKYIKKLVQFVGFLIPFLFRRNQICVSPLTPNWKESLSPTPFFNQIDKMNEVFVKNGAEDKKIDYVKFINDAIAKAQKNAPVRKSDLKSLKK